MNGETTIRHLSTPHIIREHGSKALDLTEGGYILTLTPYEIENTIWKQAVLHNRIKAEEAEILLKQIPTIYKYMKIIDPRDQRKTLHIAAALRITYYDASYITAASEQNTILVTDDVKLIKTLKRKGTKLNKILGKTPDTVTSKAYTSNK